LSDWAAQSIDETFWKKNGYLDDSSHLPLDDHPYNLIRLSNSANIYAQWNEYAKWRELIRFEEHYIPSYVPAM